MRRLRNPSPRVVDRILVAVGLSSAAIEISFTDGFGNRPIAFLIAMGIIVPLLFRRTALIPALTVAYGMSVVAILALNGAQDFSTPFLVLLVGSYTAGQVGSNRESIGALLMAWGVISLLAVSTNEIIVGDFVFPMGFAAFAWAVGRAVRSRTLLAAELHEAALRAEEAREEDAARAIADERRRIAREMHDLVGHSVSVMVVQAGGARRILDRDPERAVEAAVRIEQTGRAALSEMRRLLGLMGEGESDQYAPQPTLDGLGGLVARARDAGLPVTLTVKGDRRELPAGAELAAYRVVQEALTNAIKHAHRAPTEVVVRWDDDALELVVADRGVGPREGLDLGGSGHGLVGMHERVRVYGGALTASPGPDGGFVVRGRIPYEQSEVRAA